MKSDKMLNEKTAEYENEIFQLDVKRISNLLIFLAIGGISFATGHFLHLLGNFQTAFTLFGSYFPALGIHLFRHHGNAKEEAKKRVHHLEKIKREGIKKNDTYEKKRFEKIEELEEQQEKCITPINVEILFAILGSIAWIGGAVTSALFPAAMWVSLAGILTCVISSICANRDEKKFAQLQTRIDNLTDDLFFGPMYGYNPDKKKTNQKTISASFEKENVKAMVNPEYEKEVQEYIEGLGREREEVIPNQKVKK